MKQQHKKPLLQKKGVVHIGIKSVKYLGIKGLVNYIRGENVCKVLETF